MHFTSAVVSAILASVSLAAPAPAGSGSYTTTATTLWTVTSYGTGVINPKPTSGGSNYSVSVTSAAMTITETLRPVTQLPGSADISVVDPVTVFPPIGTALPPQQTGISTPANPLNLSLTQQLFIADTAVDRFALLPEHKNFLFDFNDPEGKQKKANNGTSGRIIKADRKTFPALVGTGAGMAVGFLGPCGFNTPHLHPRSVELQIVTDGTLKVEMAPENGVKNADGKRRVISNTVHTNQMTPFYQGSVHTQFNPTCYNATFVAAFNNEDFGAGSIADELFAFDSNVVTAAFGEAISGADVDKFRHAIPASIAFGIDQCLKECKIVKNSKA
jgi:hypothetical protein